MNKKIEFKAYVKKIAENKYQAIASTDAVDRYGDIVDQSGWQLENYLKNPVMLWAHQSDEIPVAKVTGIDRSQAGKMIVDFEFNSADGSPLAPYIQNSYDNGFLNALSVGFMANEKKGNVITQSELLEISFVPVPANQEALRLAVSKGFDLGEIAKDLKIEEKGEVAQELDDIEIYEAKWKKWGELSDVLSAMWTVFFDEATPLEDFSKLLNESIELLQEVADNDGADEEDEDTKAHKDHLLKFLGGREMKAGKVLSNKNEKCVKSAIEHMKACSMASTETAKSHNDQVTALEEMLNTSASSDKGSGKSVLKDSALVLSKEDVAIIRSQFRSVDRGIEASLAIVNKFLTARDVK